MNRQTKKHVLGLKRLSLVVSAMLYAGTVFANSSLAVDLPAQSLGESLHHLAKQSGAQILFSNEITGKQQAKSVKGQLTVEQALQQLLQGTGLTIKDNGNNSFSIVPVAQQQSRDMGQLKPIAVTASGTARVNNSVAQLPVITVNAEDENSYTVKNTSTATGLNLSLRETPQSISIITRQRIDDQNLRSIGDVLEQSPGINVQSPGSDRLYVYSRGLAIDNYQYDGIPTTSFAFTQALTQALSDMAVYDRIEILRGATGLLSGTGDPSGTVNLVRKKPTDTFQSYVSAGFGSWDLYRGEIDVSGPLTDEGNLRGRAVAAYQQADSFTDHLELEKSIFYGVLEAGLSEDTLLTVGVDYVRNNPRGFSTTGLPVIDSNGNRFSTSRSDNGASRNSSNLQKSINAFATLEQRLSYDWKLKIAANYQYSTRDYDSIIVGTTTGFINSETGDGLRYTASKGDNTQKQKGLDIMLSGPFQMLGREHELVAGFNLQSFENQRNGYDNLLADGTYSNGVGGQPVNYYNWDNYAPTASYNTALDDDNIDQWQNGVYLATRLKITDRLSTILGTRVSNYRYDASLDYFRASLLPYATKDKARASDKFTPYAGVVYDLTDNHSIYASYTSIFQPQYYRDKSGNLLDPREGNNYEAGLKSEYYGGRLNTSLALFEVQLDNDAVSDGTVEGSDGLLTAYRPSKTKTQGVDLEVSGEILPNWNLAASYSHSTSKDAERVRVRTTRPADIFKLFTTYRLPGQLDRLTIGGGLNWQSKIHYTATSWRLPVAVKVQQDSFATANLMARYQISPNWSATATIDNLFDKKYLSSLDQNFNSASWGKPRNFVLSIKYDF